MSKKKNILPVLAAVSIGALLFNSSRKPRIKVTDIWPTSGEVTAKMTAGGNETVVTQNLVAFAPSSSTVGKYKFSSWSVPVNRVVVFEIEKDGVTVYTTEVNIDTGEITNYD